MNFTNQQSREAYKKLPPEIQDLIMDGETTELVENSLAELKLDKNITDSADSEILYAMYCLQSLDDAINNIAKLSGKNSSELSGLKSTLQENIFSKYKIDINDFIESNKSQSSAPTQPPPVQKSKDEIKEDLIRRREGGSIAPNISQKLPEIAPDIHPVRSFPDLPSANLTSNGTGPVIEEGEMTHNVPVTKNPAPQYEANAPIVGTNFIPTQTPVAPEPQKPEPKPVAPAAPKPSSPTALTQEDRRYPGGVDPYREPLN